MSITPRFLSLIIALGLAACSPVKTEITNQYKLDAYSNKVLNQHSSRHSLLIMAPEASAGYENDAMLYVKKPYALNAFVHNQWANPPAAMLMPLILQSFQHSGLFYAVTTAPNGDNTDYRLDTLLIELQQNFLTRPSTIQFAAKVVLTRVSNNEVVASKIFRQQVQCAQNNPYAGVIAANQATERFTADLTHFVAQHIDHDKR